MLATAAIIAAPQAAQAQSLDRVVVFGDSLSDGGFFPTVLSPTLFTGGAGSFTTNPDPVAPEVFSSGIGLAVETAYTTGGVPNGGFNYAIGGARIDLANPGIPLSISQQIDTFVATGRTFSDNDVVYIQGGGNDLFALQAAPTPANFATFLAQAGTLSAQVSRLRDLGAGTVVTMNVQSAGNTTVQLFNDTYEAALAASGVNALFFDTDALFNEVITDALTNGGGQFGITEITGFNTALTACGGVSSLFCDPSDYVSPDANLTYILADDVHPAGRMQQIQGAAVASLLTGTDQIGELPYAAQALMRSHRDQSAVASRTAPEAPAITLNVGGHFYDSDPSGSTTGVEENSFITSLGVSVPINATFSAGIFGSYSTGTGDFDDDGGDYDVQAFAGTAYVAARIDRARVKLDATIGRLNYDDIDRAIVLGAGIRTQSGDTDAIYGAIRLQGEYDAFASGGITFGPTAGIGYDRIEVDSFRDRGGATALSTDIAFGSQDLDAVTGRIGVFASGDLGETAVGAVSFHASVSLEHDFDGGGSDRDLTITPEGAPISFTRRLREADDTYMSFEGDLTVAVREGLDVTAGVSGFAFRDDSTSVTGKVGLSLTF
ncbi:autotransporter domain-containing protein [Rhizobiaceae bacterium]|nr:autotransporter domain-containing protein [Rhizobiaceae bacterium]